MGLYTFVSTIELEDDTEARTVSAQLLARLEGTSEVIEQRWFHDLDAEQLADACGVEWGGR